MWEYGVYGLQREERLWERQLYIPYAKKRIDKFHQWCFASICLGLVWYCGVRL
jgi:hypothetical protein